VLLQAFHAFMNFRLYLSLVLVFSLSFSACVFGEEEVVIEAESKKLVLAFAEPLSNMNPFGFEAKDRQYLAQIYEPLLSYDSSFNYQTALAVSWGRLDDLTWQIRLREGVSFHDGSSFDAQDVLYSFSLAQDPSFSELTSLLSTIVSVEIIDSHKILIKTEEPDPLLLNKLVSVYMIPSDYEDFIQANGTGPYRLIEYGLDFWELESYFDYWGPAPYFSELRLALIQSAQERTESFLAGDLDVLADVPPQDILALEEAEANVFDFSSLELSYLLLNTNGVLSDPDLREVIWSSLGTDYAEALGGDFLDSSSQFAPQGTAGYVAGLEEREQDLFLARELMRDYEESVNLKLALPQGLESLGELIAEDLTEVGFVLEVNYFDATLYEDSLVTEEADLAFLGWKFELADVQDFYENVAHSPDGELGTFNSFSYENASLDDLIQSTANLLDVTERQLVLKQIAHSLNDERVILPLFESKLLMATQSDIYWPFRLDGQILASEIMRKML
jgi:peptide/nickel transport system substrate-binding protein